MNQKFLLTLTKDSVASGPFPLHELLKGSLFYPAAGFDGTPIRHWPMGVDSFVLVDWSVDQFEFYDAIMASNAFYGYEIFASRSLHQTDLSPKGWRPRVPDSVDRDKYLINMEMAMENGKNIFAEWVVFERLPKFGDHHGPVRFSLVYIRAEGAAAYQGLYVDNNVLPSVVTLIGLVQILV